MKSLFRFHVTAVALSGFVLSLLPACQSNSTSVKPDAVPLVRELSSTTATTASSGHKLQIATFNLANLGLGKMANDDVALVLAGLVRKYDVIAVQEIQDKSLKVPAAFLEKINALPGDRFQMVASVAGGTTATSAQREEYAVYFNSTKVEAMDAGMLYPDLDDDFVREPFTVQLHPRGTATSFVVVTIHTAPSDAAKEIAALRKASDWAAAHYTGEKGVIVLGDFNAGEGYVSLAKIAAIRATSLPYLWVVPDDADTTIAMKPEAHDRIVVTGALASTYTKQWGVDRTVRDVKYSDHFPVWAEFDFGGPN